MHEFSDQLAEARLRPHSRASNAMTPPATRESRSASREGLPTGSAVDLFGDARREAIHELSMQPTDRRVEPARGRRPGASALQLQPRDEHELRLFADERSVSLTAPDRASRRRRAVALQLDSRTSSETSCAPPCAAPETTENPTTSPLRAPSPTTRARRVRTDLNPPSLTR